MKKIIKIIKNNKENNLAYIATLRRRIYSLEGNDFDEIAY